MTEEFVREENVSVGALLKSERSNSESEQDIICVTVTGSVKGVRQTILTLYQLGFAAVEDWSAVQPAANPKQVISVLIRRQRAVGAVSPCSPQHSPSKQ